MTPKTNMNRLIVRKMAMDVIPPGTVNSLETGIAFLTDPERINRSAREATQWVKDSIQAVRDAREPNPWKDASDEAIAGEILRVVKEKESHG